MNLNLEKQSNTKTLSEIVLFSVGLEKFSSKKDISSFLLKTLNLIVNVRFSSFVENCNGVLKVICQAGEDSSVKDTFNEKMSQEIFDWVMKQKQTASLKASEKNQFIFIPVFDHDKGENIEHGMVVLHIDAPGVELKKDLKMNISILTKLAALSMTKVLRGSESERYLRIQEQIKSELQLTTKIHKSLLSAGLNKKILFSVLEDEDAGFNGNFWWIGELGPDINLVFMAQVLCKGAPSAMLSGYLLGEMNNLKTKAEISLNPQEVLKHLNNGLNPVFRNTGVTVNAWYGVFNIEAKKIRFANANHPDPFVIGTEQQVSSLSVTSNKANPLGVSLDSSFSESTSNISSGSKLIICTKDLLEQAARIGNRYDSTWLPQVLETIGTLPLSEMRNSLNSILSENVSGTAKTSPRLALLLEIPA